MKKHLSVLALLMRGTIWKFIVLLILGTVAEYFFVRMSFGSPAERAVGSLPVKLVFFACFLLLSVLLWASCGDLGAKSSYTIRRLRIDERLVFAWQAVWNSCAYFILWAWQAAVAVWLAQLSLAQLPAEYAGPQALMMAFYRADFLHALIPLLDSSVWVRNALMVLGLGLTGALLPLRQRRGKRGLWIFVYAVFCAAIFPISTGDANGAGISTIVSVAVIAASVALAVGSREVRDE